MITKWKAFYTDKEISSRESTWEEIPSSGLVILVWWDETTRHIECGCDSIIKLSDSFVGVNLPTEDFLKIAQQESSLGNLKFGILLSNDKYEDIWQNAYLCKEL